MGVAILSAFVESFGFMNDSERAFS